MNEPINPHQRFNELKQELGQITRRWNAHDLIPEDQQTRAREIGVALNRIGGMTAMTNAYYHARRRNRYAAVLGHMWDGIGDWLP